jgi:transcriptional regulator with XRE-family HTH domain
MDAEEIHPVKAWRTSRGLTVKQAAAQFGVSRQTWHRYENGTRRPDPDVLDRFVIETDGAVTANDWLGKEAADVVARRHAAP